MLYPLETPCDFHRGKLQLHLLRSLVPAFYVARQTVPETAKAGY
jgi:hypothetical protein